MARISNQDREQARRLDPSAFLYSMGLSIKKEGRHSSVRDSSGNELYRLTRATDGHYLYCDKTGTAGGDLIDLAMILGGYSYHQAVRALLANQGSSITHTPVQKHESAPIVLRLPVASPSDIQCSRCYLESRGISFETIQFAEQCGMLRYCGGGVLFCGYSPDGLLRNVTRRAISIKDSLQKRDLKGSDKRYPPILLGLRSKVWIVEGGCDALALRDLAIRQHEQMPTILVSGGANICNLFESEHVQEILKAAVKVTIARENEKDEETQQRTDAAHEKQANKIRLLTTAEVDSWQPANRAIKDLAAFNLYKQMSR